MIKPIEQLIEEHPFFAALSPDQIGLIAGCGTNVVFSEGTMISREGEPADEFYVIRRGRIAVSTFIPSNGDLVLQTLDQGDVMGFSWLFPPFTWAFDSRAVQEVHAISLDGKCLRGKCDNDTALGYDLMKRFAAIMIDRLRATRLQLIDVYGGTPGS